MKIMARSKKRLAETHQSQSKKPKLYIGDASGSVPSCDSNEKSPGKKVLKGGRPKKCHVGSPLAPPSDTSAPDNSAPVNFSVKLTRSKATAKTPLANRIIYSTPGVKKNIWRENACLTRSATSIEASSAVCVKLEETCKDGYTQKCDTATKIDNEESLPERKRTPRRCLRNAKTSKQQEEQQNKYTEVDTDIRSSGEGTSKGCSLDIHSSCVLTSSSSATLDSSPGFEDKSQNEKSAVTKSKKQKRRIRKRLVRTLCNIQNFSNDCKFLQSSNHLLKEEGRRLTRKQINAVARSVDNVKKTKSRTTAPSTSGCPTFKTSVVLHHERLARVQVIDISKTIDTIRKTRHLCSNFSSALCHEAEAVSTDSVRTSGIMKKQGRKRGRKRKITCEEGGTILYSLRENEPTDKRLSEAVISTGKATPDVNNATPNPDLQKCHSSSSIDAALSCNSSNDTTSSAHTPNLDKDSVDEKKIQDSLPLLHAVAGMDTIATSCRGYSFQPLDLKGTMPSSVEKLNDDPAQLLKPKHQRRQKQRAAKNRASKTLGSELEVKGKNVPLPQVGNTLSKAVDMQHSVSDSVKSNSMKALNCTSDKANSVYPNLGSSDMVVETHIISECVSTLPRSSKRMKLDPSQTEDVGETKAVEDNFKETKAVSSSRITRSNKGSALKAATAEIIVKKSAEYSNLSSEKGHGKSLLLKSRTSKACAVESKTGALREVSPTSKTHTVYVRNCNKVSSDLSAAEHTCISKSSPALVTAPVLDMKSSNEKSSAVNCCLSVECNREKSGIVKACCTEESILEKTTVVVPPNASHSANTSETVALLGSPSKDASKGVKSLKKYNTDKGTVFKDSCKPKVCLIRSSKLCHPEHKVNAVEKTSKSIKSVNQLNCNREEFTTSEVVNKDESIQGEEKEPWMTEEIKKLIKKKSSVFNMFKKTKSTKLLNLYKRLEKQVLNDAKKAKMQFDHQSLKIKPNEEKTKKYVLNGLKNVVLVTDEQDRFLVSKVIKEFPEVSIIHKANLGYHNSYHIIRNHKWYGKGTLFVMLCGVMTALRSIRSAECNHRCNSHRLVRFQLTSQNPCDVFSHLKAEAKFLRQKIENNHIDKVIFGGLLPVQLKVFDMHILTAHFKKCGHSVQPLQRNVYSSEYGALCIALQKFNEWALADKEEGGFSQWSHVDKPFRYIDEKGKMIFTNATESNGRVLSKKCFLARKKALQTVLQETHEIWLSAFDGDEEEGVRGLAGVSSKEEKSEFAIDLREILQKDLRKVLQKDDSKESSIPRSDNLQCLDLSYEYIKDSDNTLPRQKRTEDNPLQIVIVCDDQDSYLQSLQLENFSCLYHKEFSFHNGYSLLENLELKSSNTLYVMLCGISTILQKIVEPECRELKCSPPLCRPASISREAKCMLKEIVYEALYLRKRLIDRKPQSRVIFSGLLPPSLFHVDQYAVESHFVQCKHKAPLHTKDYFTRMNSVLHSVVTMYNAWAKEDAAVSGFPGWNIEKIFTSLKSADSKKIAFTHSTEEDGQTLTPEFQENRRDALLKVIRHNQNILLPRMPCSYEKYKDKNFFPKVIGLVYDKPEASLEAIRIPNVSHVHSLNSELCFQDIFALIQEKEFLPETLFVIVSGLANLLKRWEDPDCKTHGCSSALKRVKLISETADGLYNLLVVKALDLRKEIVNSNEKHAVIFTGLLPVDIEVMDESAVNEHFGLCKHHGRFRSKQVLRRENQILAKAISYFNCWAKKDAADQGFPDWSMDEVFTSIRVESEPLFLHDTESDGYTLTALWKLKKMEAVVQSIKRTFISLQTLSESEGRIHGTPGQECQLLERENHKNSPKHHPSSSILMMSNTLYWHILHEFSSPDVTVIAEQCLDFHKIPELVHQHKAHLHRMKVCILPLGLYSLTEFFEHPSCQQCTNPLHYLSFRNYEMPSGIEMAKVITDMVQEAKQLKENVQKVVDPDCLVLFVPPIRALVVLEDRIQNHNALHEICERNHAFCTNEETYKILKEYYNAFSAVWMNLLGNEPAYAPFQSIFKQYKEICCGEYVLPVKDSRDYTCKVRLWIDMIHNVICKSFDISGFNEAVLPLRELNNVKDHDISEKNDGKVKQVVVVGENHLFEDIQKFFVKKGVYFIDENLDFTDGSRDRFCRLQRRFPDHTMWIVLTSVSLLSSEVMEKTKCILENCSEPLIFHGLKNNALCSSTKWEEINRIVAKAKNFALWASKIMGEGSVLCLPPVCPIIAMLTSETTNHSRIHYLKDIDSRLQILYGGFATWKMCSQHLDKSWMKMISEYSEESEIKDLLDQYAKKKIPALNFVYNVKVLEETTKKRAEWDSLVTEYILKLAKGLQEHEATGVLEEALEEVSHDLRDSAYKSALKQEDTAGSASCKMHAINTEQSLSVSNMQSSNSDLHCYDLGKSSCLSKNNSRDSGSLASLVKKEVKFSPNNEAFSNSNSKEISSVSLFTLSSVKVEQVKFEADVIPSPSVASHREGSLDVWRLEYELPFVKQEAAESSDSTDVASMVKESTNPRSLMRGDNKGILEKCLPSVSSMENILTDVVSKENEHSGNLSEVEDISNASLVPEFVHVPSLEKKDADIQIVKVKDAQSEEKKSRDTEGRKQESDVVLSRKNYSNAISSESKGFEEAITQGTLTSTNSVTNEKDSISHLSIPAVLNAPTQERVCANLSARDKETVIVLSKKNKSTTLYGDKESHCSSVKEIEANTSQTNESEITPPLSENEKYIDVLSVIRAPAKDKEFTDSSVKEKEPTTIMSMREMSTFLPSVVRHSECTSTNELATVRSAAVEVEFHNFSSWTEILTPVHLITSVSVKGREVTDMQEKKTETDSVISKNRDYITPSVVKESELASLNEIVTADSQAENKKCNALLSDREKSMEVSSVISASTKVKESVDISVEGNSFQILSEKKESTAAPSVIKDAECTSKIESTAMDSSTRGEVFPNFPSENEILNAVPLRGSASVKEKESVDVQAKKIVTYDVVLEKAVVSVVKESKCASVNEIITKSSPTKKKEFANMSSGNENVIDASSIKAAEKVIESADASAKEDDDVIEYLAAPSGIKISKCTSMGKEVTDVQLKGRRDEVISSKEEFLPVPSLEMESKDILSGKGLDGSDLTETDICSNVPAKSPVDTNTSSAGSVTILTQGTSFANHVPNLKLVLTKSGMTKDCWSVSGVSSMKAAVASTPSEAMTIVKQLEDGKMRLSKVASSYDSSLPANASPPAAKDFLNSKQTLRGIPYSKGTSAKFLLASKPSTPMCVVHPIPAVTSGAVSSSDTHSSGGYASTSSEGLCADVTVVTSSFQSSKCSSIPSAGTSSNMLSDTSSLSAHESAGPLPVEAPNSCISIKTTPTSVGDPSSVGIPTAVINPTCCQMTGNFSCAKGNEDPSRFHQSSRVTGGKDQKTVDGRKSSSSPSFYGIVILNVSTSIKEEQIRQILEACGPVESLGRPRNILGKPAEHVLVKFRRLDVARKVKSLFSKLKLSGNFLEVRSLGGCIRPDEESDTQFDLDLFKKVRVIAEKLQIQVNTKDGSYEKQIAANTVLPEDKCNDRERESQRQDAVWESESEISLSSEEEYHVRSVIKNQNMREKKSREKGKIKKSQKKEMEKPQKKERICRIGSEGTNNRGDICSSSESDISLSSIESWSEFSDLEDGEIVSEKSGVDQKEKKKRFSHTEKRKSSDTKGKTIIKSFKITIDNKAETTNRKRAVDHVKSCDDERPTKKKKPDVTPSVRESEEHDDTVNKEGEGNEISKTCEEKTCDDGKKNKKTMEKEVTELKNAAINLKNPTVIEIVSSGTKNCTKIRTRRKDITALRVTNASKIMSTKILKQLFNVCGSIGKGVIDQDGMIFNFPNFKGAFYARNELSGFRFLDKILKVEFVDKDTREEPKPNASRSGKLHYNVLNVLKKFQKDMLAIAQSEAEKGVNVFTFKTEPCQKQKCSNQYTCFYYHSNADRRRNPALFSYSAEMCSGVQQKRNCDKKDQCEMAHSTMEVLFHRSRYRNHVCVGWNATQSCPMVNQICPFAHPESPDLFFHPSWQDLYIVGLGNTLNFLSGAILNHYRLHLPALQQPYCLDAHPSIIHVRILVITPSDHIVQLLAKAVNALARSCHHDVAAVTVDTECADASVIIGTPGSLARMLSLERKVGAEGMSNQNSSFDINNLQALIVDDFSGVLKEINMTPEPHTALRQVLRSSGVNKVVVTDKFNAEEVKAAATLLNTTLTEVIGKDVTITTSVSSVAAKLAEITFEKSEQKESPHPDTTNKVTDCCKGAQEMSSPSQEDKNRIRVVASSFLQIQTSTSSESYTSVEGPPVLISNQHFPADSSSRMKVSADASSKEVRASHTSKDHSSSSFLSKEKSSRTLKQAPAPSAPISYSSTYMSSLSSQKYSVSQPSTKEYYSGYSSSKENISSLLQTQKSSACKTSLKHRKDSSVCHRGPLYESSGKRKDSASPPFSEKHKSSQLSKKGSPSSPLVSSQKHSNILSSRYSPVSRKDSPSPSSRHSPLLSSRQSSSSSVSRRHSPLSSSRHSPSLSSLQSSSSSASRRHSPSSSSRHSPSPSSKQSSSSSVSRRHNPSLSSRQSSSSSVSRRHSPSLSSKQSSSSSASRRHSPSLATMHQPSHLNSEKGICSSYHKERYDDRDSHLRRSRSLSPSSERKKPPHKSRSSCKHQRSLSPSSHKCRKRHKCKKHECKKQRCSSCCKKKCSNHSAKEISQSSTGVLLETSETSSSKGAASSLETAQPALINSTSVSSQHSEISSTEGDHEGSSLQILPESSSPSPCENCITEVEPSKTNEFLKLEEAMLKEHKAEYQVYLDAPELHPEYRNSYNMFLQYYQERFEKVDVQQKDNMWKVFWQELLTEAEEDAWKQKRQDLVKQLESEVIKRKQLCLCKKKATDILAAEAEDASRICHPLEGPENTSQGSIVQLNNQSFFPTGISLAGISKSTDICLTSALTLLDEVCDSLGGLFGSLIKKVIKEIENLGNTKAAFLYLGETDTVELLRMTTDKLRQVSMTAQESKKIKLLNCCDVVEKLIAHVTDH